jgi:hypothetical protein
MASRGTLELRTAWDTISELQEENKSDCKAFQYMLSKLQKEKGSAIDELRKSFAWREVHYSNEVKATAKRHEEAKQEEHNVLVMIISELKCTMKTQLEEKDGRIAMLEGEMKSRLEEKDERIAVLDGEKKAMQDLISKQSEELPEKVARLLDDRQTDK